MPDNKEKNLQVGKSILTEDDLLIHIEQDGEQFTLKYPNPLMKGNIEVEIARRLGGMSRDSFSGDHVMMTTALVTVDFTMVPESCPSWFTPWNCPDELLIMKLYNAYLSFRDQLREGLRAGKYRRGGQG